MTGRHTAPRGLLTHRIPHAWRVTKPILMLIAAQLDAFWRALRYVLLALLIGGDVVLIAWAFVQDHNEGAGIAVICLSFLAVVGALVFFLAGDVRPVPMRQEDSKDDRHVGR